MKAESVVHNRVKAARARLGLSQQELARSAGVTRQTIGGIEAGLYAPSAGVALRVARALGSRVEDLFWLEEDLPAIDAVAAETMPAGMPARVSLARVGGRWVAHPLQGTHAFRMEMVPADGVGTRAAGGSSVRVELLDDPRDMERTAALAGCTPALSLWARAAERSHAGLRVHWSFANSTRALHALARGEVHGAGVHLCDPVTGEDNVAFVRQVMGDRSVVLINLGLWEEGLVVRPGNPRQIRRAADLAEPGLTVVNREKGSGARAILELALGEDGIPAGAVVGFDRVVPGHLEVAAEVAYGRADAGVSSACVAAAYGLEFVPLRAVRYDLAVIRQYLEEQPVRQLLATLDHRWVRSQLRRLAGYDTTHTGEIVAEIPDSASGGGA